MTAPEKIRTNAAGNAIVTPHLAWDTDVEYIRADLAQAMVAAAREDTRAKTLAAVSSMLGDSAILALATAEEEALLEKMLGKVREDALREAASRYTDAYAIYEADRTDGYAKGYCGGVEAMRAAILALIPTADGEA